MLGKVVAMAPSTPGVQASMECWAVAMSAAAPQHAQWTSFVTSR